MIPVDRSRVPLRVVIGWCCLIVCLCGIFLGAPAYELSIDEQAPTERAMAQSLDAYSPADIEPVAFETLSPGEQTAVSGAIESSDRVYTDRGRSDDGTRFTYRNDIVNQYFVSREQSIYLVRVVIDIDLLSLIGGILVGVAGIALVASGLRGRRSGHTPSSSH
jgi:hypothetical protein